MSCLHETTALPCLGQRIHMKWNHFRRWEQRNTKRNSRHIKKGHPIMLTSTVFDGADIHFVRRPSNIGARGRNTPAPPPLVTSLVAFCQFLIKRCAYFKICIDIFPKNGTSSKKHFRIFFIYISMYVRSSYTTSLMTTLCITLSMYNRFMTFLA